MKYKDLPTQKILTKLRAVSFSKPSKNRDVYVWSNSLLPHVQFIENERYKLIKKYGEDIGNGTFRVKPENMNAYRTDFLELLDMDITENIPQCPIETDWFDDDNCQYPEEKELWISADEMNSIFNSIEKEQAGS